MNYYQLEFSYDIKNYHPESNEAWNELMIAEKFVITLLKEHNVNFKHSYSFPDGSLYKYVKCTEEQIELIEYIFSNKQPKIKEITIEDPLTNPYKVGYSTLEEYFNDTGLNNV